MKRKIKVGLATLLTTSVALSSMPVYAATSTKNVDEVNKILKDNTASADFWIDFIQNSDDKTINQLLPQLLIKLNKGNTATSNEAKKELKIEYKTITEGFDWGPAISKLVIKPSVAVDPTTLSADAFTAISVRNYKDFDFVKFQPAEKATDHAVARKVVNAYMADEEGNANPNGKFIALEMEVGPALAEGSPFNYNILSGKNEYVDTYYNVSLSKNSGLKAKTGEKLTLASTSKAQYTGDAKLIVDDFVNNQKYSKNGVNLTYASYVPETASTEKGKNPLIIFLHGAGEGGTDTTIPLLGTETVNLAKEDIQQYFGDTGAYILAPQTPTVWMDALGNGTYNDKIEGNTGTSYYTEALTGLIEDYVAAHPEIDTDRIYIGGDSNGGYMTVNLITENPDYFAAAFPICEPFKDAWLTDEKFKGIADMPMWITHAKTDSIVPIVEGEVTPDRMSVKPKLDANGKAILANEYSNALYNRLKAAGNDNVYYSLYEKVEDTSGLYFQQDGKTPYEYMGHWSWIPALNDENTAEINGKTVTMFEWLGQQSK